MAALSILEMVGREHMSIMSPVSICMLSVALLVYTLSPPQQFQFSLPFASTNLFYVNATDSVAQKLLGAFFSASVFVVLVAVSAVLLIRLYRHNLGSFLRPYARLSAAGVLLGMGGPIFLSIIQRFSLPVDIVTCFLTLLNFSVIGAVSVAPGRPSVPIFVTQSYMVVLAVVAAAWITKLPEWTTWALLVALSAYDYVAVLAPWGPLRVLHEMLEERGGTTRAREKGGADFVGFLYETRPTTGEAASGDHESAELPIYYSWADEPIERETWEGLDWGGDGDHSRESISLPPPWIPNWPSSPIPVSAWPSPSSDEIDDDDDAVVMMNPEDEEEEMPPLEVEELDDYDHTLLTTSSDQQLKLGLGDFVFYSVALGRAAMYDLMLVYACYVAIISGLAITITMIFTFTSTFTLLCPQSQQRHHRALPALPIPIALVLASYFLTRFLLEPFLIGISTNFVMF